MADGFNNAHNINDEIANENDYQMDQLLDGFTDCSVDFSWMSEFTHETFNSLEHLISYLTMKMTLGNGFYDTAGDFSVYANGVGRAVSMTLDLRRMCTEESLTVLLVLLGRLAYERGVRDATEERLSKECKRLIAARVGKYDRRHDRMDEFCKDISGM